MRPSAELQVGGRTNSDCFSLIAMINKYITADYSCLVNACQACNTHTTPLVSSSKEKYQVCIFPHLLFCFVLLFPTLTLYKSGTQNFLLILLHFKCNKNKSQHIG